MSTYEHKKKGYWQKSESKLPKSATPKPSGKKGYRGKGGKLKGPSVEKVSPSMLADLRSLASMKVKVEYKSPVPPYRGSEAPQSLCSHPGYVLQDTKESDLLKTVMSRMFSGKWYEFRITTALNMSSSGTGQVNSVIANSSINSTSDFAALSGVFSEFFIKTMRVKWEPVSMYNYPLTGAIGTNVSSLPIGVADLQHAQATYTSMTAATENWRYEHKNTGRPYSYAWINSEKPTSTVSVDGSTGVNAQSWADVRDAGTYTGTIQFISQSPPPALPVTTVLGTYLVEWDLLFRVRL